MIILFGQDQFYFDATAGGRAQGGEDFGSGNKVGGCDENLFASNDNAVEEYFGQHAGATGGTAVDESSWCFADGCVEGKVCFGEQFCDGFVAHEVPVAEKGELEFVDDGTFGTEVVVANGGSAVAGAIVIANINAAEEGGCAIDNEVFAMVA